jgi:hypothetical protein
MARWWVTYETADGGPSVQLHGVPAPRVGEIVVLPAGPRWASYPVVAVEHHPTYAGTEQQWLGIIVKLGAPQED